MQILHNSSKIMFFDIWFYVPLTIRHHFDYSHLGTHVPQTDRLLFGTEASKGQ